MNLPIFQEKLQIFQNEDLNLGQNDTIADDEHETNLMYNESDLDIFIPMPDTENCQSKRSPFTGVVF